MAEIFYEIGWEIQWSADPSEALGNLAERYNSDVAIAIFKEFQSKAPSIKGWMQDRSLWQDRTGDAYKKLWAKAEFVPGQAVIMVLGHGVPYGTYLEGWNPRTNSAMLNAGKWSVVEPALDYWAPTLWGAVKKIMGK